jgi:hypothetical protein
MTSDSSVLLNSLTSATSCGAPFRHWLASGVMEDGLCASLAGLAVPAPDATSFEGRRDGDNQSRFFLTPDVCARFDCCRRVVSMFKDPAVIRRLEETTGADLSGGQLRIEYAQDRDGFWLQPHTDIRPKLITFLIYLSDDPALSDSGTDLFDGEGNCVKTAPYEPNTGLIFVPSDDTWHGFRKRPIRGNRTSLIVNYVTGDWRSVEELA